MDIFTPAGSVAANDRDEILRADAAFFRALLEQDRAGLEMLLAPDFLIVDVRAGSVTNRADFLDGVGSGLVSFESIDTWPEEVVVREYGSIAIVVGATKMRFHVPDGSSFTGHSRYTHVFANSSGAWQLVSAQGTAIPAD